MSENARQANNVAKLDLESSVHTIEGRNFLNQLNRVSHILSLKGSEVVFKGGQLFKTGYVGDCKSVQLFKCPGGYFLFCNRAFTMNNWSAAGETIDEVVSRVDDAQIKQKISAELSAAVAAL